MRLPPDGDLQLELGAAAAKWAHKILHPLLRLDKLGVKPESRVALLGGFDENFITELRARVGKAPGAPAAGTDLMFLAAEARAALQRLGTLRAKLQAAGGIWVVYPKGRGEITWMSKPRSRRPTRGLGW